MLSDETGMGQAGWAFPGQSPNMLLGGFIVDGLDGIEGLGIEELRVEVTPCFRVGIERWIDPA